jgi:hypothetical protein
MRFKFKGDKREISLTSPISPKNNSKGDIMTTKKQQLTNVQNAQLSTGPKTKQGKVTASQNALKHGLLVKDLILKDENAIEFDSFRKAIYQSLSPLGYLEEVLAEKIASSAWRFRRLIKSEKHLFEEKDDWCVLEPKFSDAFS